MLEIDDLHVALDAEAGVVRALDGLRFCLTRGETFALVGESGCGKSMTALALMRLLPDSGRHTAGAMRLEGDDLLAWPEARMRQARGGRIGIIFQEPSTSLNPVMRVGEQVAEAIEAHTPLRGAAARSRAVEWLARVGIPEPQRRALDYPFQLSGGQKQRVMIAIALAAEPDYLIADEPTTALDVTIQAQILDLIRDLQRERQLGVLLITHDLAVVRGMAHTVALMYAGQIVEMAPAAEFFAAPRHPYARLLLDALPDRGRRGQRLAAIEGTVPPLWQPFAGCRFAPRCDRATTMCAGQAPLLGPVAPGRTVRCWLASEPHAPIQMREPAEPLAGAAVQSPGPGEGIPLLDVRALSVRFAPRTSFWRRPPVIAPAVDGVSFQLQTGRTLALVGESGCGKTTTGKALAQLLRRQALIQGEALFQGRDLFSLQGDALRAARRDLQIVFQDPFASMNPRMRVAEVLEEGMVALRPEWDAEQRQARLHELVEQVGLRRDALTRWPHEFSGGQRQRIAIARALAVQPRLIICDEPTSALDVSVQAQILNLLRELQQAHGLAYLFITHNLSVVEYVADEVAVMQRGRIVEQGACDQILGQPRESFTKALLASVPRLT
ncbi:ABC transporter ATP-binding protein [Roseateles sp. BYS87W]|uniref:ABC transporter ATP-binding protein n=1 Tax=Pelomonas baiyunensis TaxID=3299026 RepID=A0ABW7GWA7_9BURK